MNAISKICAAMMGLALAAAGSSAMAEERRELKAHVHGHGKLNIAVEGNKVSLDLDAPGADILGTESFANAEAKAAALKEVQGRFSDPLKVFVLPPAAQCTAVKSEVEFEGDGAKDGGDKAGDHAGEAGGHADITAEFELSCGNPSALTGIEFKYFDVFKNAESLDVAIVTSKGQTSAEVSRASPRLDLAGLM